MNLNMYYIQMIKKYIINKIYNFKLFEINRRGKKM